MFPRKIKNFNAFLDGITWVGRITEGKLPELALKTDEYRGGGMHGSIDIVMGQDKMEAEVTLAEWDPQAINLWGENRSLVFRAAAQGEGDFSADAHVYTIMGRWLKITPDTLKVADTANLKMMCNPTYFKASNAGTDTVEIDIENMIHKVAGVDQMAAMRAAMGA